jgi:hypothetical protein
MPSPIGPLTVVLGVYVLGVYPGVMGVCGIKALLARLELLWKLGGGDRPGVFMALDRPPAMVVRVTSVQELIADIRSVEPDTDEPAHIDL